MRKVTQIVFTAHSKKPTATAVSGPAELRGNTVSSVKGCYISNSRFEPVVNIMLIVRCFVIFSSFNLPATAKAPLPVPPQLLAIAPQLRVEHQEPNVLGQGMTLSHEHFFYISQYNSHKYQFSLDR